jgi:DNA-directed RNA polymerase specialized sigma24 family protein
VPGPESVFAELVQRIRQGDQEAAAELVRLYEPLIRRSIRLRLSNANMRNALDSIDICQSVLSSFFMRAALGQFDLNQPADLQKLLIAMARNKLKFQARKQHAQRRDQRRLDTGVDLQSVAAPDGTASRQLTARELLEKVYERLSPEERRLVELRNQGMEWHAIAATLTGSSEANSPDALRKKLARALDRVSKGLGMDED